VCEAVESGSGQSFAAENFGPVFEGQVCRDDDAVAFVRGADDIEQEFGGVVTFLRTGRPLILVG
jgi:hypothetical protein